MIQIRCYRNLPEEACYIRDLVFVQEQGFREEFDSVDVQASHIVLFVGEEPAGVCRVYGQDGQFFLGRVAVLPEYRGKGLGEAIVLAAEEQARTMGAKALQLHAQCHITGFYSACGYTAYGDVEYEQDCPHIWMKKEL